MAKEILKIITVSRRKKSGGVSYDIDLNDAWKLLEAKCRYEAKFKIEGIEHYSFRVIDQQHLEVRYFLET
jgi:hypothetical protein